MSSEHRVPAGELGNDGAIMATLSSGLFRDGTIAGTFSLGMGGYEYVCRGTSSKDGALLRVFAQRVMPLEDWEDTDTLPMEAADFFRGREYAVITNYYGLIVEWQGRRAVIGKEIIIIPNGKVKPVGEGRISRPGEPPKPLAPIEAKPQPKHTPARPVAQQGSLF
jgi:hypothetical protein